MTVSEAVISLKLMDVTSKRALDLMQRVPEDEREDVIIAISNTLYGGEMTFDAADMSDDAYTAWHILCEDAGVSFKNEAAIARCRALGWYIAETKKFRGKPHGVYKFYWPDNPENNVILGYDYYAYIDTTDGTSFAEAATRLAQDFLSGKDGWKICNFNRIRPVMERTLEAMKDLAGGTLNVEVARILSENPDLPVKVSISGELMADINEWYIGDLISCEVTEYVEYDPTEEVYFGRGNENLRESVRDSIWNARRHEIDKNIPDVSWYKAWERMKEVEWLTTESLPDAELDRLTDEYIAALDWKPCIRLRVGWGHGKN